MIFLNAALIYLLALSLLTVGLKYWNQIYKLNTGFTVHRNFRFWGEVLVFGCPLHLSGSPGTHPHMQVAHNIASTVRAEPDF